MKDSPYPDAYVNHYQMNRIVRHRLRNLCFGMSMALERMQEQTASVLPQASENCALMLKELDHLMNFTHRMDLLFSELPEPEEKKLVDILLRVREEFAEKHPYCDLELEGPQLDVVIASGNYLSIILGELLDNAAEAALEPNPRLTWSRPDQKILKFAVTNQTDAPLEVPLSPPQPFFTTRGRHDGLGLAIVQRLVNHSNATLTINQNGDDQVCAEVHFPTREFVPEC
ncbi:MAG: sensor histidine kinase [Lentisphaerae bacterium]|nr:MAG: sensor histidine kinase [Lentisphaerota bacterium]